MQRWIVVVVLLTGCLSLGPKQPPNPRTQILAGVTGAVIAGAAITGAALAHDEPIVQQTGVAMATAAIPMAAIYLGEEPEQPTTPGGIYSTLGGGMLSALGATLLFGAPMLGTYVAGDETARPNTAASGAFLGVAAGGVVAIVLGRFLPKWARVVAGAIVIGSAATLGYQLGGGGPP